MSFKDTTIQIQSIFPQRQAPLNWVDLIPKLVCRRLPFVTDHDLVCYKLCTLNWSGPVYAFKMIQCYYQVILWLSTDVKGAIKISDMELLFWTYFIFSGVCKCGCQVVKITWMSNGKRERLRTLPLTPLPCITVEDSSFIPNGGKNILPLISTAYSYNS